MPPLPPSPSTTCVQRARLLAVACLLLLVPWPRAAAGEAVAGTAAAGTAASPPPLSVVASTSILADLVSRLGGDQVEVRCLSRPGLDAHDAEASPADLAALVAADLVVVNGLGLERRLDQIIARSGSRAAVVVASAGIAPRAVAAHDGHDHDDGHQHAPGAGDPHAWLDVRHGMAYAENIRAALIAAAPDRADDFRAWGDLYLAELRLLDAWIRRELGALPPTNRRLVITHDSLGYFAEAYGLEVIAVQGPSPEGQPDARRIAAVIDLLRAGRGIPVFAESTTDARMLERIAAESGARLGGCLYTDSLGPPGHPADSYIGMHQLNVRTLARALR